MTLFRLAWAAIPACALAVTLGSTALAQSPPGAPVGAGSPMPPGSRAGDAPGMGSIGAQGVGRTLPGQAAPTPPPAPGQGTLLPQAAPGQPGQTPVPGPNTAGALR